MTIWLIIGYDSYGVWDVEIFKSEEEAVEKFYDYVDGYGIKEENLCADENGIDAHSDDFYTRIFLEKRII